MLQNFELAVLEPAIGEAVAEGEERRRRAVGVVAPERGSAASGPVVVMKRHLSDRSR